MNPVFVAINPVEAWHAEHWVQSLPEPPLVGGDLRDVKLFVLLRGFVSSHFSLRKADKQMRGAADDALAQS